MRPGCIRYGVVTLATLLAAGCATVGPKITRDELKTAQEFYQVKSQRHIYAQVVRIRTVGERLLSSVPEELRPKHPKPSFGTLLDELTLTSGRVFGIPGIEPDPKSKKPKDRAPWRNKKACLIAGVLADSPADRAGLQAGDLLLRVGKRDTPNVRSAVEAINQLKPETEVTLLLEREGNRFEQQLRLGVKPYPVTFHMAESDEVNAFASPGQVNITTGLLRFAKSDDELAVVLGHELAHLTQGHYAKKMGIGVLAGAIGLIVEVATNVVVPGIGGVISNGIQAPFSKDFEREADYVGLSYAYKAGYQIEAGVDFWDRFATELPSSLTQSFFNTHPTSPERLLRLKKTIEELKKQAVGPKP